MHKLFEFIRSIYVVAIFLLLEMMAISVYSRSTSYTQARLLAESNRVVGGIHSLFAQIGSYFTLRRENRALITRLAYLEERLAHYEEAETAARLDRYMGEIGVSKHAVMAAAVVGHSINRPQNFITLNRGSDTGVTDQMAVLTASGALVGYVEAVSNRYAAAVSLLNTRLKVDAKLAGTDYLGNVYWDGTDSHVVILDEVSKYADPQVGQEVVSAGFSKCPAGVLIGQVINAELNATQTQYRIRVRLAADMGHLGDVLLVENRDRSLVEELHRHESLSRYR